jgi:hypothetical protein
MRSVRIESNGWANTRVWIDDIEQKDIYSVSFNHTVNEYPMISISQCVRGGNYEIRRNVDRVL